MSAEQQRTHRTIEVTRLAIRCGLGLAQHGWRVEMSVLDPVDRKTVEIQGYKAAVAELKYAL